MAYNPHIPVVAPSYLHATRGMVVGRARYSGDDSDEEEQDSDDDNAGLMALDVTQATYGVATWGMCDINEGSSRHADGRPMRPQVETSTQDHEPCNTPHTRTSIPWTTAAVGINEREMGMSVALAASLAKASRGCVGLLWWMRRGDGRTTTTTTATGDEPSWVRTSATGGSGTVRAASRDLWREMVMAQQEEEERRRRGRRKRRWLGRWCLPCGWVCGGDVTDVEEVEENGSDVRERGSVFEADRRGVRRTARSRGEAVRAGCGEGYADTHGYSCEYRHEKWQER